MTKAYESVWDAIEDTPAEAENMKVRSQLMHEVERVIRENGWSQTEAAKHLGLTQPRVSELLRGKIDLFSIDKLVTILAAAGQRIEVRALAAA